MGPATGAWDAARLERAVRALVARCRLLAEENARLAHSVEEREQRVEKLDSQVRELNQVKRDVAKRIDDLIGQLDSLDAQYAARRE